MLLAHRSCGSLALSRQGWSLELVPPATAIPRDTESQAVSKLVFSRMSIQCQVYCSREQNQNKGLGQSFSNGAPFKTKKSETHVFLLRISIFVLIMHNWNRMKGGAEMFYSNALQALKSSQALYSI